MAKQVSSTYGDALFQLAVESNQVDIVLEELTGLIQVLQENEDLIRILTHPEVVREDKLKLLQNVFQGRLSDAVMGTLMIVVRNDRSSELQSVLEYVIGRIKEYKKIGIAYVTSAVELGNEQKSRIEQRLIETTEYLSMEMHYKVDASLLGGLVIRIEDRVVDSSIKRQLERMSTALSQG
jgi:F-type H+-transporting ATPase subunit delta